MNSAQILWLSVALFANSICGAADRAESTVEECSSMRRYIAVLCLLLGPAVRSVESAESLSTAPRPVATESATAANYLVENALLAEIEGDSAGREIYLQEALDHDRQNRRARWHQGYVQIDGQWASIEEATHHPAQRKNLKQYRERRAATGNAPREQFELAAWCKQRQLNDEARAHFFSALNRDASYASEAPAFGLVQHEGIWMTRAQAQRQQDLARSDRVALARWKPILARLRSQVMRGEEPAASRAREQLLAIRDPAALSAIESVFSENVPDEALLAVAMLKNIPGQRAATLLTRQSVYNADDSVRRAAAEALAPRSLYCYAPLLLAALEPRVEASFENIQQEGAATVRLTLLREGPMSNLVLNETLQVAPSIGAVNSQLAESQRSRAREQAIIAREAERAVVRVQEANARIDAHNKRVETVLANAAGATGSRPRDYWEWWYQQNDVYYPPEYPTQEYNQSRTELYGNVSECFIAGTQVWTSTGQRPIETIEIGDRVLAQDIETGELAFKPVLATSVRPPAELLKLQIGGQEFITTRGHPVWVIGAGWRMAKELSVGDRLHTATGAVEVEAIAPGPQAEAHNFVVAEFNNYFVGDIKLLVHDNSLRRHTDAALPGLVLAAEAAR
jgi:hypothetical protein